MAEENINMANDVKSAGQSETFEDKRKEMAGLAAQVEGKRCRINMPDCKKVMTKSANESYQESRQ